MIRSRITGSGLSLVAACVLVAGPSAADLSGPFADTEIHWSGWASDVSQENTKDTMGLPDITDWYFEFDDSGILQTIRIDYVRTGPDVSNDASWVDDAWKLLRPGDLFIGNGTGWTHVYLQQDGYVTGRSGVNAGVYSLASPLAIGAADAYVTTADPGPWGGGWNVRNNHPYALKDMSLLNEDPSTASPAGSFTWDQLIAASPTIGTALFTGLGIQFNPGDFMQIGFTWNCANDVLIDGTSVPNEAVPEPGTLLLLGSGLAGVLIRRRRSH
jgi:hypothetical protein